MKLQCPACGSFNVRQSQTTTWMEKFRYWLGISPVRCKNCDERFESSLLDIRNAMYSRCPRCYRQDLSTWDTSHYNAPTRWHIYMAFGARRRRCEGCRHNFISFRPAKAKYVRRGPVIHATPSVSALAQSAQLSQTTAKPNTLAS